MRASALPCHRPKCAVGEHPLAWNLSAFSFVNALVDGSSGSMLSWTAASERHEKETGQFPIRQGAPLLGGAFGTGSIDAVRADVDTGEVASADALEDLVRLHHRRLASLAYPLCGSSSEAEDIAAEAYARTWPRLARGQVDDPGAYLRRAVVNGTASWRRHRFVVPCEELRRRASPTPDTTEEQVAGRDELWQALQTLPFGQR